MKKIFSVFAAAVMIFALSCTTFAASTAIDVPYTEITLTLDDDWTYWETEM